ncbi:MAG: tetratricopeptide repeat protein, partial [Candidatus Subteraquimicrobiales bacterium]|nr:tetratricopeptide repeat protein [Candidatus Subteraquimicrobiales bacterium]
MAKCWTCGTHVSGYRYTCSSCESLAELKSLQKKVESYGEGLDYIAQVQQEGFKALNDTLSAGLSEIASAIEWGFGEISWQLQQQMEVLGSIDHTLKTPSETKANEWRLHAEELRRRGVLEESEELFLKALNEYRLDYRIYVGLAETYLQMNRFDKARVFLEKSLPHAPKKEIDYKSHSYRLIGHIYACEEDYNQAAAILRHSIELSPTYEDGHYDYAQYCAQMRNKETCLSSLQKAILAKPLYWYLAQKEQNLDPVRSEVEKLLSSIITEASRRVKDAIAKAENALKEAHDAVSKARQALSVSRDKAVLKSITLCGNAEAKLKLAKYKVASGDYVAFLEAKPIAEESKTAANNALNTAYGEREHYIK